MSNDDTLYQRGLIITDDIAVEPILDFDLYRNAIVNIIEKSYPKFTIGIFGDWGTGKTTLMNSINEFLENDGIIVVRFETWRYEREEQFALIPLLKTIAFKLPENDPRFSSLKQKLKIGATNLLKKTPEIISTIISKYVNEEVGIISKEALESFKKGFNSKMELLTEVDRDTLYFDGFNDIKEEIDKIRKREKDFRIVVFIDDLDRCSPKKTLEVLESIKIFLGMDGFIYVIGMSHDIVSKLIDIEYKETGVKGEHYIKKIIQIPITLPKWDIQDINGLIKSLVTKKIIDKKYRNFVDENIEVISTAVENNPRELKRFLNKFIVAAEIFSSEEIDKMELLVIQAIQLRWNSFYDVFIKSDKIFLIELIKYLELPKKILGTKLEDQEYRVKEDWNPDIREILRDFIDDYDLWDFLRKNLHVLKKLTNLNLYRRATEGSKEPVIEKKVKSIKGVILKMDDIFDDVFDSLAYKNKGVVLEKNLIEELKKEGYTKKKALDVIRKYTELGIIYEKRIGEYVIA